MRKFKLYTYDKKVEFDLNNFCILANEPQGLGNAFEISYKDDAQFKEKTNVKANFENIVLMLIFNADCSTGYQNYKKLADFLTLCGKEKFLFNYDDTSTHKFCEVILKSITKSEIDNDGVFNETLTLDRQSYWFKDEKASFSISNMNTEASTFSLSFPFGFYGNSLPKKVEVENTFFEKVPTVIKINGGISSNIVITLSDVKNTVINQIALSTNNIDGQEIEINAITKKITITNDKGSFNGYDLVDKSKQSFLFIPNGMYFLDTKYAIN